MGDRPIRSWNDALNAWRRRWHSLMRSLSPIPVDNLLLAIVCNTSRAITDNPGTLPPISTGSGQRAHHTRVPRCSWSHWLHIQTAFSSIPYDIQESIALRQSIDSAMLPGIGGIRSHFRTASLDLHAAETVAMIGCNLRVSQPRVPYPARPAAETLNFHRMGDLFRTVISSEAGLLLTAR